jgi:hypothetical protein
MLTFGGVKENGDKDNGLKRAAPIYKVPFATDEDEFKYYLFKRLREVLVTRWGNRKIWGASLKLPKGEAE